MLADAGVADVTVPVTYMNSSAAIKAFCRRAWRHRVHVVERQDARCDWAFAAGREGAVPARPAPGPQHGGARAGPVAWTTASCSTRTSPGGGLTAEQLQAAKMILWRGHCSVHGRFTPEAVDEVRAADPRRQRSGASRVPVRGRLEGRPGRVHRVHHPTLEHAPPGSSWAIGTELNLVRRLATGIPDKEIVFLEKTSATARP